MAQLSTRFSLNSSMARFYVRLILVAGYGPSVRPVDLKSTLDTIAFELAGTQSALFCCFGPANVCDSVRQTVEHLPIIPHCQRNYHVCYSFINTCQLHDEIASQSYANTHFCVKLCKGVGDIRCYCRDRATCFSMCSLDKRHNFAEIDN